MGDLQDIIKTMILDNDEIGENSLYDLLNVHYPNIWEDDIEQCLITMVNAYIINKYTINGIVYYSIFTSYSDDSYDFGTYYLFGCIPTKIIYYYLGLSPY